MKIKVLFISLIFIGLGACTNTEKKAAAASEGQRGLSGNTKPQSENGKSLLDAGKPSDARFSMEQLDNTKGLSNSSVNAVFQDSENLLWIGTWDGLNRYDGTNFKIFRPELDRENSLSNQVILKIAEDHSGRIWILTMHGINRYDKKTDVFQRYYFSRKNKPPLSESEFNMALDAAENVFCAVKDWGIGYFNGVEFQSLRAINLSTKAVLKMEFMATGELLVLYENNELYALSIGTSGANKKTISKVARIADHIKTFGIVSGQKIGLVTTAGKAILYSLSDKKSQILAQNGIDNCVGSIAQGLVLSGKSGYAVVDSSGKTSDPSVLKQLENQKITTLIQGSENVLWAGTDGDGIVKIHPLKRAFNLISKAKIPELDGGIVRAFLEVEGNSFWVGTKGKGLLRFSSDFYLNPQKKLQYTSFNASNSAIDNAVFALCKGQEDLIFIGTDGDGVTVFDLKKSKLINWSEILGTDTCSYFKSTYTIYQDKKGFIWLGTNGYGMIRCKIERSGDQLKVSAFRKYLADTGEKTLSSNIIFSIVPKNENQLWIGTRLGGLSLFDKESENFRTYKNIKNDPKSLSNNDILCLQIDAGNRLWIGTSFGLNLLEDLKSDGSATFKSFTVKQGLPNNTIHGIVSDKKSNLWLSTNFGLSNFIVNERKFINYTKNEGLQNNEFADGAFYQIRKSDFIFMGGIKGFNYFLPEKIKESTVIPDLLINKISGQNQAIPYYQGLVLAPDAPSHPAIALKHNQNFFDIELGALTYINSEKCQYAYQLTNFDTDWNFIGSRRTISFTNVPKGNYALWVKWSNSDGVWSKPVHAIDIQIKPVFWQSDLAVLLYVVLVALFILFVLSYYKKQQSLRQNILFRKREEALHENRLTFFTNVAHEFQTPLTLIVGPAQKLAETAQLSERNQKFVQMIQRNSSRLLFLTQQLLEFRKAEDDYLEVTVKEFDLVNLVEQIAELFDEWALDKNIDYNLAIPSTLPGWFDKDKIEKIVFNLMSNAFKYTPVNGKIDLKFEIEDAKTLTIAIVNTGKGIPQQKLDSVFDRFFLSDADTDNDRFRTGIGLAYIKKLVTVLRGEVLVSSIADEATTFIIRLPCSEAAFTQKELDVEVSPVLISHHLKNILEEIPNSSDDTPNKMAALEVLEDHRKTVLIVEDEKEIHLFLKDLLGEQYKIMVTHNGVEALEIMENTLPDIIISDVMMPLMDGVALCKKIKTDSRTCHIPFIMLTAKDSVIHRIEGLESGANSYIPKPFYPDHLLVRIQKLLEEKELLLKHFTQDPLLGNLSALPINNDEKDFVKRVIELIRENIDDENLQSLFIEKELGISNSQLYRKIKQLFGFTPGDLIRTIRLKHAAALLRKNVSTVSEVCYQSGFNNRSYFYREFKKMYNATPKNYQLKYKSKG